MKKLSNLTLNQLEVESFESPADVELSGVKGGTTPACVAVGVAVGGGLIIGAAIAIIENLTSGSSSGSSGSSSGSGGGCSCSCTAPAGGSCSCSCSAG